AGALRVRRGDVGRPRGAVAQRLSRPTAGGRGRSGGHGGGGSGGEAVEEPVPRRWSSASAGSSDCETRPFRRGTARAMCENAALQPDKQPMCPPSIRHGVSDNLLPATGSRNGVCLISVPPVMREARGSGE